MVSKRATRRFNKQVYYLVEREASKTAAQAEAKRLRTAGYRARITVESGKGLAVIGKYAVWSRKK